MVEDADITSVLTLPQVQTSMETQVSQVLLETGVTQEKPTPFQALPEPQDKKASEELQVRPDTSNTTVCRTRTQYVILGWPE